MQRSQFPADTSAIKRRCWTRRASILKNGGRARERRERRDAAETFPLSPEIPTPPPARFFPPTKASRILPPLTKG